MILLPSSVPVGKFGWTELALSLIINRPTHTPGKQRPRLKKTINKLGLSCAKLSTAELATNLLIASSPPAGN